MAVKIYVNINYLVFEKDGGITEDFRAVVNIEPNDLIGFKYTITSPKIGTQEIESTSCVDEGGNAYTVDSFKRFYVESTGPIIQDKEYSNEAALGNIKGVTPFFKSGRNPLINTNTDPEDIWNGGGEYTGFPTEVETLEIFSSELEDNPGGTGAWTVSIENLLNANFEEMPPILVTLDGQTPVSLGALTYSRANRMRVRTAGSANGNIGELTLRHTTTVANIFAVMPIGKNQTQIFVTTTPANKTLIIPNFNVKMSRTSGAAGSANVTINVKSVDSNVWNSVRNVEITDSQDYKYSGPPAFVVYEKTDVKATFESVSDNGTIGTGEANGFLYDN